MGDTKKLEFRIPQNIQFKISSNSYSTTINNKPLYFTLRTYRMKRPHPSGKCRRYN